MAAERKPNHSYPWYPKDWRNSERVLAMTAEQRDVYRNLIDACWEEGSLPTNETLLRRLSLAEPHEWKRSWPVVREEFTERNGRLWHRKVDAKWDDVMKAKGSRSASASNAARARWSNAPRNAPRIDNASEPQCESDADSCGTIPLPIAVPKSASGRAPTAEDWPLTLAAVQQGTARPPAAPQWPTADEGFVKALVDQCRTRLPTAEFSDQTLADVVLEAAEKSPKQKSHGLFLTSVPEVLAAWARQQKSPA